MIDLTKPNALTLETVAALIASTDDSVTRQLCVTHDGKLDILDASVVHDMIPDLLFRVESWGRGNGYSGPDAAQNDEWVKAVHDTVATNWPNPRSPYVEMN